MPHRVIIVGAGFAGLAAAGPLGELARERRDVTVTLLDRHSYTTMVPALPDLAGGRYADRYLTEGTRKRIARSVAFYEEEVTSVSFDQREVTTRRHTFPYDYLVKAVILSLASGRQAGRNVAHAIRGRPLQAFRPSDPGWVIPFGDVGVGMLFGTCRIRGRLPLALHFAMCGLRNYNLRNLRFFWGRAANALRPRGEK
jgi:NADH dehydrogenase FAD-containing subunit